MPQEIDVANETAGFVLCTSGHWLVVTFPRSFALLLRCLCDIERDLCIFSEHLHLFEIGFQRLVLRKKRERDFVYLVVVTVFFSLYGEEIYCLGKMIPTVEENYINVEKKKNNYDKKM